jgi:hypothetical protein
MASVGRHRFAEAVTTTFETVRHLYRTIDRLNLDLRNALEAPPTPLPSTGGTSVGKMSGRRDDERQVIRAWYGRLHAPAPGLGRDDEPDEDDSPDEDVDGDGEPRRKRRRPPLTLTARDRLLALKLILFEPGNSRFEPVLRYAVIGDWAVKGRSEAELRLKAFAVPRNMLRRLLGPLPASANGKQAIPTNAKARLAKGMKASKGKGGNRLSYHCFGGVKQTLLYDLDSPENITALVRSIKRHWVRFGGSPQRRRRAG